MKEYLLLSVVLILCQIIYCEKIIRCPRYGKHYFAHPLECTEFVMCVDGKSKIHKCSPGTHYDALQQLCGPVECNRCFAYPSNEKTYLHSTRDCTEYFICLGHKQIAHRCPTGMYYDRYRQICDYKDGVECILNELPPIIDYPESSAENSDETPSDIPVDSSAEKSDETPSDIPTESSAEKSDEINDETPNNGAPIVVIPTTPIEVPQNEEYICPANGFYILPHPTICSWYYWCQNGKSLLQSCFPGLIFDGKTKECLPPANGVCFSNYKPVCAYDQQSFEPHGQSCQHYFICIHGKTSLQKCAEDLSFDMNTRKCNNPSISKCFVEQ